MKKLIAFMLILALIVPASSMAADRDPIAGCWYMVFDAVENPELISTFAGADRIVCCYIFKDDNTITCLELDLFNDQGTPTYNAAGKWSLENGMYQYSIVGLGNGDAFIRDGCLWLSLQSANNLYMKLRHMDVFDPYSDYSTK